MQFKSFIDVHVHPRDKNSPLFEEAVQHYAKHAGACYMLNFTSEMTFELIKEHYDLIRKIADEAGYPNHQAFLIPILQQGMSSQSLSSLIDACLLEEIPVKGFKLFPKGQSTNSDAAPDVEKARELIAVLKNKGGLVLHIHMEDPDEADSTQKEASYVAHVLPRLLDGFEDLPTVLEHISTKESIAYVKAHPNVKCSITPHHLLLSLADFGVSDPSKGEAFLRDHQPLFFCKPLLQTEQNRRALCDFVLEDFNSTQIMAGSDTAPHPKEKKDINHPPVAAGIFMGDVVYAYVKALFARHAEVSEELMIQSFQKLSRFFYQNAIDLFGFVPIQVEPLKVRQGEVALYEPSLLKLVLDMLPEAIKILTLEDTVL